jgi:hypothetical protein
MKGSKSTRIIHPLITTQETKIDLLKVKLSQLGPSLRIPKRVVSGQLTKELLYLETLKETYPSIRKILMEPVE